MVRGCLKKRQVGIARLERQAMDEAIVATELTYKLISSIMGSLNFNNMVGTYICR